MKALKVQRRGDTFHLVKRVPKRYEAVESRKVVWISLHTNSESLAKEKALRAWRNIEEAWEARLAGDTSDADRRFAAAQNLAKARGYRWLTAGDVSKLPRDELLKRIELVAKPNGKPDLKEAAALLGGAMEPSITVTRALELYWTLTKDKTIGMSEDQKRRWKNPRKKAIANFVSVVGNKEIASITADDMLDFREWWADRLASEGLAANSANKDLIHLGAVLKTVNKMKRLGLNLPLGGLSFADGNKRDRIRPPFSENWIKNRLLAPNALDGLNEEARAVIHVMVNTGMRPSEIVGLLSDHIRLDADVPHVEVLPEGKRTKTGDANRVLPLVGISLAAMKRHPEGFPNYRFKDLISATVNSFLRENGLLETKKHTLYSLRHSFEDRMLDAKVDERIRRDFMGHSLGRERYGKGATLERAQEILAAVAY